MRSRRALWFRAALCLAATSGCGTGPWVASAAATTLAAVAAPAVTTVQPSSRTLTIRKVWSRATAPGAAVGVIYFEIVNTGAADELLRIESPAAQRVEMHATMMVGGMMEMRPADTVIVPAAGHVAFEPGGLHAMLLDLRAPLKEGAYIPLILIFRHAGRLAVQAVVEGSGAMTGPAAAAPAGPATSGFRLALWPPHAATPDFALVDTAGRLRTPADFRGDVVVLFFGFVHCPDVCPAELFKLGLVMQQLGAVAAKVQVVFVTLDPARDTRKVLKDYVSAFDPRFIGLSGSAAQIGRAAGNFSLEYARVPIGADYTIDHSTSTFVLDAVGRLRLVGTTTAGVADYAHDLRLLAAE